jgi:hypothetical protein
MSETKTRLWIALFVLAVFVCGLSVGIGVSAWFGPRAEMRGARGPFPPGGGGRMGPQGFVSEQIVQRLGSDPSFSDEQRQRLEALFAERQDRFREFNRDMRARFETEQASLHDEIAAILTPSQMELFESARRSRGPGRRWRGPGGMRER